ncbi:MAG: YqgE/AlgH family protein [bacterium]|nr:YqgE/AlgH family protein [bacterium]MCY4102094.1 YqgE/AlgH family protein [bacterium]
MSEFHARKLLVATPLIDDGNFDQTVVLLLEHTAEGAVGIVLNRPSSLVVSELLTGWEDVPGVLYSGGPVSPESLIGLAREWPGCSELGWKRILDDVGSVDLSLGAEQLAGRPGLRLFFGYAGWDANQLDGEIAAGAWFVVDPEPGDVLTDDPGGLRKSVLARQPDQVSWFQNYPDDLRSN